MPRKKDIWLILAVLLAALVIFLLAKQMPQKSIEGRTADVTMAPDAIEMVESTPKPDVSASGEPADSRTPASAVTGDAATAEPTATVPAATDAAAEPTHMPPEVRDTPAVTPDATAEPAQATPDGQDTPAAAPDVTEKPAETAAAVAGPMMGPVLERPQEPVKGHVIIMVQGRQYGDPIPMDRDKIITVRQDAHTINRVHITRDSVHMESSTCENQDCVGQGMVTLENYGTRLLGTYIVCMPNGVTVEMVPVSEPEAGQ